MQSWDEVRRWRRAQRRRLIEARKALPVTERQRVGEAIVERLSTHALLAGSQACIGFYWPINGEPDVRSFVSRLVEHGADAALPVVVEKNSPVEFHRWRPGSRMRRQALWGIPVPAARDPVLPDIVLVPLVGFDAACFRLGYGGGYYDRTLAYLDPRPTAIGIGLEAGRLPSIYPQPHDIPMDVIATEAIITTRDHETTGSEE